jgi:hypothetical protein
MNCFKCVAVFCLIVATASFPTMSGPISSIAGGLLKSKTVISLELAKQIAAAASDEVTYMNSILFKFD